MIPTLPKETRVRVGIISLADARKEARRVLAEHTLGKTRPRTIVYEDAKALFLEECEANLKPFTAYEYKRHLDKYFKFGRTPMEEIGQDEIVSRLKKLNKRPSEKRHAFVSLRRFMRWSRDRRYISLNPMDGLASPPNASRKRVLALTEVRTILHKAIESRTLFGSIVALLILTGQRKSEIASIERPWISNGIVTLPETKNGLEHSFPLCQTAQQVIEALPDSPLYLFPAKVPKEGPSKRKKSPTYFNGWSKAKREFDAGLEGVAPYTLNDLRRTLSTNFAELGIPIAVTEKLLNHVSGTHGGVQGTYNRYSYMKEMGEAVERYEAMVLKEGLLVTER